MRLNTEGYAVSLPSGAHAVGALDWRTATQPGAVEPHGESAIPPPVPMGEIIFSACGCDLIAIASVAPALRGDVPYAAVILDRGDPRTRQVVGRRLLKLLHTTGLYLDGLDLLTATNGRRLAEHESVVIIATWDSRAALVRAVTRLLRADPTMQRALLRTAETQRRVKYDAHVIRSFERKGGGLRRQLFGPFKRKWRFSDFSLMESLSMTGVRLVFEFEDYELLEHAEATLSSYARRNGGAYHVHAADVFDVDSMGDHTDMIHPQLHMFMRWNTSSARAEMADMLREICGTSDQEPPSSLPSEHCVPHSPSKSVAGDHARLSLA